MIRRQTSRRVTFRRAICIGLFALLAVSATTMLVSPKAEAIVCGNGSSSTNLGNQWLLTPEALARTAAGDCPDSLLPTCRQECFVGCSTTTPMNSFRCFAN